MTGKTKFKINNLGYKNIGNLGQSMSEWKNKLYYSDNLDTLKDYIEDEPIGLVYLDPLFNSQATNNVLFADPSACSYPLPINLFDIPLVEKV